MSARGEVMVLVAVVDAPIAGRIAMGFVAGIAVVAAVNGVA